MEFNLLCHPQSPMPAIESVHVQVLRTEPRLISLTYTVIGDISTIVMPLIMSQERADDLWRTTCFELFLARPGEDSYLELNFSPCSRWAAYRFTDYRAGRKDMELVSVPRLDMRVSAGSLELGVVVDLTCVSPETVETGWQAGLSAIIEGRDGTRSYWALAHPAGDPDFHNRDCFTTILEAPATE